MPARPLYLGTDVLQRARDLEFRQRADRDIWKLGFDQQAESDITGLSKLIEPPQLELQAAPAQEPLPIVVSDRPDAMQLQRQAQERQMPQQPMMQPQQQAPAAASGAPVAMPTASQDGQTAQRRVGTPNGGVEQWSDLVDEASRAYGVPQAIIKGIMDIESGGRADAVSAAGAMGLMQVMPFHYGEGEDGMDPRTSVLRGAKILADNYRRWGTWDQAAAAYFGAIDAQGNITGATDATGTDGTNYVRLFRDAANRYGGVPDAAPAMQRLSLNAAPAAAPGRAAPPAPAGVSSAPAGAPPAPWEMAGASDGAAPMMLKENDETAAFLPGDGGTAPAPEYDPRQYDEGQRESRPAPILPTDPTVSDPAYTQSPTGMTYGPIQQGDVQGPPAPERPYLEQATDWVQRTAAPLVEAATNAYGREISEGNRVQDEIDAALDAKSNEFANMVRAPIDDVRRGVNIANRVLMATPQATADVVNAALERFGLGRDALGVDLPLVGRIGIADFIDLGPVSNIGMGRTGMVQRPAQSIIPNVGGAIEDVAGAGIRAAREGIRTGAEALGRGLQGVGREVAGGLMDLNPAMTPRVIGDGGPGIGRAMADGAGEAALPPSRRFYHGTNADFEQPDPSAFRQDGIFGPGYYLSDNPDVASAYALERRAASGAERSAGPNVRPVDLPDGLRMLDAATPVPVEEVARIREGLAPDRRAFFDDNVDLLTRGGRRPITGDVVHRALRDSLSSQRANAWLASKGYDGITHPGSLQTPVLSPQGEPLDHSVTIIFPESLTKIRNAFSGEVGGATLGVSPGPRGAGIGTRLATDAGNALAGSMVGAIAPADSNEERLRNTALGAAGFPIAGRLMRRAGGALGTPGIGPNGGRPVQRTVEWLAEQIDYTKRVLDDLDPATEGELIGQVQDRLGRLQGEWVDAVNARRALEPRIRSEVGRRVNELPIDERTASDFAGIGRERVAPESGVPRTVDDAPRSPGLNSAIPGFDPTSAAMGGAAGAMSEGEDGEMDPLRTAGALAVAGIMGRKFPGMQRAIDASQRRAAAMAARGIKPLNPLQWAGEAVKTAGYSSMIGIRTATVNMAGNVFEPIWGVPKEGARAVARAVERKNPAALREPGEMFFGALTGLSETGGEILQALRGQGRYGSSPDHPFLSERTINPVGHALASGMEFGGRVFSGVPDAFFGTIARRAGERRAAAQIATDAGLRGDAWKARVAQILNDRDEIDAYMRTRASLAGQASSNALMPGQPAAMVDPDRMAAVEKMVKDGGAHADDMTYRNKLGTWGEGFKNFVTFGNTPVVGTLTAPFVTTPWNARTRMLEKTPIGFGMNTYNRPGTARTRFDKWYDAALGTPLLIGLAMGPAAAGRVTGSGPSDPNERKTMEENGWKPYSTLVTAPDGNEYYIPNRNIGNWGLALNVIGEIHDEMAYQKPGRTPRDQIESVARRVGRIMQDDVYAGGLVDLVGLLTEPDQTGMGWVAQQAARLTPYAATARDISTAMDPNERERPEQGDTWVGMGTELRQRWQQATGQRSELDPKTNAKGEPMPNEQAGWRAFAPRATQAKHDPIIKEILANDAQLGKPREAFTVTATGSDAPDGGVGTGKVKLNRMEQAQWKRHRWEYIQNVYAELMADQEFQSAPESIKQKIWRGQMTSAGKYADGMIKEQWGDAEYERRVNEAFGNLRARAS